MVPMEFTDVRQIVIQVETIRCVGKYRLSALYVARIEHFVTFWYSRVYISTTLVMGDNTSQAASRLGKGEAGFPTKEERLRGRVKSNDKWI